MPRRPRIHVPGGLYHAILRGNHQQVIFHCEGDYLAFEGILARSLVWYEARVHAYCWMQNHVHLAVQVGDAPLGRLMQAVASVYARLQQRRVPTTGHLFERRYWATLVDADAYLLALVRYIHLNPVNAGIVRDPADYPWSSHGGYLGRCSPSWLTLAPTLALFGGCTPTAVAAYTRFMADVTGETDTEVVWSSGASGAAKPMPESGFGDQRRPGLTSLEQVVVEVAAELDVEQALLESKRRDPELVRARLEIARRALAAGVATLNAVAARLGRSASTLSEQLNRR